MRTPVYLLGIDYAVSKRKKLAFAVINFDERVLKAGTYPVESLKALFRDCITQFPEIKYCAFEAPFEGSFKTKNKKTVSRNPQVTIKLSKMVAKIEVIAEEYQVEPVEILGVQWQASIKKAFGRPTSQPTNLSNKAWRDLKYNDFQRFAMAHLDPDFDRVNGRHLFIEDEIAAICIGLKAIKGVKAKLLREIYTFKSQRRK